MQRTWFAVVRPTDSTPIIYPVREIAEAAAVIGQFNYPDLGPWEVIEVCEVSRYITLAQWMAAA